MNRISKLQNILRTGTAGRVDNTVVDTFTAALILKKYKSLTAKSKAKFAALTVDKMVEVQTKKKAAVKKTAVNWGTDQAKYWAAVKSDAETIAEGLRDGSIDDQGEAVHEAADSAVTYTMDALGILIHSSNDDALFDEGVGDLKGVQSASDVYTKLAYWAYVADLNEALSELDTTPTDSDEEE